MGDSKKYTRIKKESGSGEKLKGEAEQKLDIKID